MVSECIAEEWRPIEGFEGLYEVSNTGRVKSLEKRVSNNGGIQYRPERILRQNVQRNREGRHLVILCKEGKTFSKAVSRLVASAFIPNPENKPCVDHIDTNPQNNHVSNLRWVTAHENAMNPLTRVHNSLSKMGHPCYRKGPLSEEHKKKISDAHKGKKWSDEYRAKIMATWTNERRENASRVFRERNTGRHWKVVDGKRIWYD